MKIEDIKIGKISTPLKHPYKIGKKVLTFSDEIVIKIITDTGDVGYGSAAPTPLITGETENSIIGAINHIKHYIVGLDLDNLEEKAKEIV